MSQLKLNIAANFVGKGWTALMNLALVPFYIKFMGIEAYALVGIYLTLLNLFSLLDLGLSTTLNRELARLSIQEGKAGEIRNLVRTLEIVYWVVAVAITLILVGLVPLISNYWIHPQQLSTTSVQQALLVIGLVIGFQFPFTLYSGGLLGLQRQILLNGLVVIMTTFRGLGSVLILWLFSPTIQAFFGWQLLISVAQTIIGGLLLWRCLPKGEAEQKPKFDKQILRKLWRFAAGMTGITFLSLTLTQMDKVILSNLLTLEIFGYYNVATTVSSGLFVIMTPIFTAIFPRLSQLVLLGDETAVKNLYHRSCQLMSVALLPVAIIVALFSPEILWVWQGGNQKVVENSHLLVSLLIIGTALNGLMNLPYALTLAYGWTKFAIYQNIIAVALLIPLLFWATASFGAVGAAAIWVVLNSGYVIFSIQALHTRLLKHEKMRWYLQDVGLPLIGALSVALLGRWLIPGPTSIIITIISVMLTSALTLLVAGGLTFFTNKLTLQRHGG